MSSALAVRRARRLAPAPIVTPLLHVVENVRPAPESTGQALLALDFTAPVEQVTDDDVPAAAARALVQAALEVVDGRRNPVVLQRAVAASILTGLARSAAAGRGQAAGRPPAVLRLRAVAPRPGVCEVASVVVLGGRIRAVAARLTRTADHWVLDAFDLG